MKNKLEKTGHGRAYYRARGFFGIFLFGIFFLSLAAIPVGITYTIAEARAQEEASNKAEERKEDRTSGFNQEELTYITHNTMAI